MKMKNMYDNISVYSTIGNSYMISNVWTIEYWIIYRLTSDQFKVTSVSLYVIIPNNRIWKRKKNTIPSHMWSRIWWYMITVFIFGRICVHIYRIEAHIRSYIMKKVLLYIKTIEVDEIYRNLDSFISFYSILSSPRLSVENFFRAF